jgi:hypothetical protein
MSVSNEWKSCCFRLQPQAATFSVQVFFSVFLVVFACFKLSQNTAPDPLWVSILTTTVGVWLPSPIHTQISNGFNAQQSRRTSTELESTKLPA